MIIASILVVSFAGLVQIIPLFFQHSTTQAAGASSPTAPAPDGPRHLHPRGLRRLPFPAGAPAGGRSAALRFVLAGLGIGVRPSVPVGFQAHGSRPGAPGRALFRRVAPHPPAQPAHGGAGVQHAGLSVAGETSITGQNVQDRMRALRLVGVPYSDEEIAAAPKAIEGKTEEDALVAYLQGLGVGVRKAQQARRPPPPRKPPRRPSTPPGSRPPSRPREADHGLHQRNRHRHLDGNLFGIVWWACSRGRQSANSESAMLPFALPDEFGPAQQDGANRS